MPKPATRAATGNAQFRPWARGPIAGEARAQAAAGSAAGAPGRLRPAASGPRCRLNAVRRDCARSAAARLRSGMVVILRAVRGGSGEEPREHARERGRSERHEAGRRDDQVPGEVAVAGRCASRPPIGAASTVTSIPGNPRAAIVSAAAYPRHGLACNARSWPSGGRGAGPALRSHPEAGDNAGVASKHDIHTVTLSGDVDMPIVGFGTWRLRVRKAYECVRLALEAGYRHIDTATMYGNEAEIGRALRDSGVERHEVFLTTKLPAGNAGRERETLASSLRALGTGYVDLWLVHWPPRGGARPLTWREFVAVREQGLARAVGVSNYSIGQIDELVDATGQTPTVNQIPWSPRSHDPDLLAAHRDRGVVVEGYSPLKGTDLRDPVLAEIASKHGVTPAQVVLRWHIEHGIVVIPKSEQRERIASNLDLFGFSLDPREIARIEGSRNG